METLDFIKLACSKDVTRYNLNSVYRDKDCYVATDGHRLHYSNGLTPIEKGHYLDEKLDAQFPDWQRAFPTIDSPIATFELSLADRGLMTRLDALLKIAKTVGKDNPCRMTHLNQRFELCVQDDNTTCSVRITTGSAKANIETVQGINLAYLMDVLKSAYKTALMSVQVEYYGDNQPWKFTIPGLGTAIIMPMRLR